MSNRNLLNAFKNKNDEFYTRYEDIESELSHYPVKYFKDKVIYCPCDVGVEWLDVPRSNFIKYFENNKKRLGYKKLLHTSLQEGYDFRSEECKQYFEEADIVVTNPPFSLFREFVSILEGYKLHYIIIGSFNGVKYKEIFQLLKDKKLFLGYTTPIKYKQPEGNLFDVFTYWYTNLNISKYREPLILTKKYDKTKYPKYINYDAIDVANIADIPCDYDGLMGVPLTFLYKYNSDQFELIGIGMGKLGQDLGISKNLSDKEYKDLKIESNDSFRRGHLCFRTNDGVLKVPFTRILIRRKR